MARHLLRGLWIGAIAGFLIGLIIAIISGYSPTPLQEEGFHFECPSIPQSSPCSTGTFFFGNLFTYTWAIMLLFGGAIAGSLIGLAFKKKKM